MKKKVTLSLDSNIYKEFQDYCEKNAIMLSKRIELIMVNELNWVHKGVDRRKRR